MDFFSSLPPGMLLELVRQRQNDIRDQVARSRAASSVPGTDRRPSLVSRAVRHLRQVLAGARYLAGDREPGQAG